MACGVLDGARMQQSITPCQRNISDRFPVASFVVNLPPDRLFEIVCATEPGLFRAENRHARAQNNFFTSRGGGLLRAPAGHATYLLPPDQLRRFAGKQRLYFALASYGNARGDDPELSIPSDRPVEVPCIRLSADFTGRTLDRSRIRRAPREAKYGGPSAVLTWGGDAVARRRAEVAAPAPAYDDGYPPELWKGKAEPTNQPARALETPAPVATTSEPGYEPYEEMGLGEAYGRPTPRSRATSQGKGAAAAAPPGEPPGAEDTRGFARAPRTPDSPRAAAYGRAEVSTARPVRSGEPAGYEDARPLRMTQAPVQRTRFEGNGAQARHPTPAYGGVSEPSGYEDAREIRSGVGQHQRSPRTNYGGAAVALDEPAGEEDARGANSGDNGQAPAAPAPVAPVAVDSTPPANDTSGGVDDAWQEEDNETDLVAAPSEGEGEPLTIRRKFEILLPVADAISGAERYTSVVGSVEYDDHTHSGYQRVHHGLHWGIVHFTQRSGALGRALRACERRDSMQFKQAFGPTMVEKLLQITGAESPEARLQPVGGALLWAEPWLRTFREAGKIQAFQAAQNEVAIEHYFDRNLGFAAALGLMTDRALAVLFDRSVHMGLGGARAFVLSAISPLGDESRRATALAALGHSDLAAFQAAQGLAATGRFGSQTHAAMIGALRALGPSSPVTVPSAAEALDRLVTASLGRRFEQRLRTLRTSTAFRDSVERAI